MSKKRVRTLLRVSSRQQLHDDDIPIQRAEAEQYIAKRSDWEFDKEYIEKAVSAYKNGVAEREVLQKILEDAKKHEFEVLLTYMSDRIGRQEEYSFYVATLNRLGIEVWTIRDGQLKTEEHTDRLINFIRFWQNEGESKKTSMRVRDTQRELIKKGKFVGGKAPFGYKLMPSGEISNHGRLLKKPVIVEESAEIVRRIYHLAVYQGMGYEKIAKTLNEEGVAAVNAQKWKAGTIAGILKNPIYMGYPCINRRSNQGSNIRLDRRDWVYSEVQVEELVIVPPWIWEKAQQIREGRKAKINASKASGAKCYEAQYNVPFNTAGELALIGFTYCGYCGKRLQNGSYVNHWTTKSGEKKSTFAGRYICRERCKERSCYSQGCLEKIVFDVVDSFMEQIKTVDMTQEVDRMCSQRRMALEKEEKRLLSEQRKVAMDIETLEEKIPEAIRGDYCFGAEKLAELIAVKKQALLELEREKEEIGMQLQNAGEQQKCMEKMVCTMPDWKAEFREADTRTKQMLLSTAIDRILVKDGEIHIKFKICRGILPENNKN